MIPPVLRLSITDSRAIPGELSWRIPGVTGGDAVRRALREVGFRAGDHVLVIRESDAVLPRLAVSFIDEIKSGAAQRDPGAFVDRWMSVVAELESV